MAVAKRKEREKPMKIEQRKVKQNNRVEESEVLKNLEYFSCCCYDWNITECLQGARPQTWAFMHGFIKCVSVL